MRRVLRPGRIISPRRLFFLRRASSCASGAGLSCPTCAPPPRIDGQAQPKAPLGSAPSRPSARGRQRAHTPTNARARRIESCSIDRAKTDGAPRDRSEASPDLPQIRAIACFSPWEHVLDLLPPPPLPCGHLPPAGPCTRMNELASRGCALGLRGALGFWLPARRGAPIPGLRSESKRDASSVEAAAEEIGEMAPRFFDPCPWGAPQAPMPPQAPSQLPAWPAGAP